MPDTPQDAGSSLYDSGGTNLDILESVGNSLLEEKTTADGGSDAGAPTAAAEASAAEGSAVATTERPEWFETAPDELKGLMDHKNVSAEMKKWLEETYGELNGFRTSPVGTREAIAELAEIFPGGIEDMRVAHEQAQAFTREMEQFRSGDPAQQGELLASLLQDEQGPEAFIALTGNALELLKETLPRDYTALASGITQGHLNEVTDGKFASFFDSVRGVAAEYQAKLDAGDQEGAARLASKLGGYALQMADWWGSAKPKLGFGEKTADGAGQLPRPSLVAPKGAEPSDKELVYAQRDANYWAANYMTKHDSMVNPLVNTAVARDLAARKLDLPESWKRDVAAFVADGIKKNLGADKQYSALEQRVYKRGAPQDPRRWDNSEKVAQVLLNAAKAKATALIPGLVKQALDRIAEIRGGGTGKGAAPGAAARTSAGGPPNSGSGKGEWEQEMKEGKISSLDAIQRIAGV
jgi:hypothetical protein